jgi:hypothetical protein
VYAVVGPAGTVAPKGVTAVALLVFVGAAAIIVFTVLFTPEEDVEGAPIPPEDRGDGCLVAPDEDGVLDGLGGVDEDLADVEFGLLAKTDGIFGFDPPPLRFCLPPLAYFLCPNCI